MTDELVTVAGAPLVEGAIVWGWCSRHGATGKRVLRRYNPAGMPKTVCLECEAEKIAAAIEAENTRVYIASRGE